MLNDCDHRRLIWKSEITKAETYLRASLYFCSLDSLIRFIFINNLQECPFCHSNIIRGDMLNGCDHRRLIWKSEITKAETYLRASLYFCSLDSLIWFTFVNNLQECPFYHFDIIREDILHPAKAAEDLELIWGGKGFSFRQRAQKFLLVSLFPFK